ncbi:MAG: hypothetical protein MR388_05150 [Tenericutes bacterium]|nr:hypothetical protein [Mycoplasmatota bacterium]
MKNNTKEIDLLTIQLWATIFYVGSLFISISLTYDEREKLKNKSGIFSETQNQTMSIFNRWLVLFLTLSFLYVSYQNVKLNKQKNQKTWPFELQLFSSELSTIAAIIVLYVVIKTSGEQYSIVSGIENPNL